MELYTKNDCFAWKIDRFSNHTLKIPAKYIFFRISHNRRLTSTSKCMAAMKFMFDNFVKFFANSSAHSPRPIAKVTDFVFCMCQLCLCCDLFCRSCDLAKFKLTVESIETLSEKYLPLHPLLHSTNLSAQWLIKTTAKIYRERKWDIHTISKKKNGWNVKRQTVHQLKLHKSNTYVSIFQSTGLHIYHLVQLHQYKIVSNKSFMPTSNGSFP